MKAIIACAGTAGHINPGLAIANKLKEEENAEILFIGTDRGLENDLVPKSGYELKQINAYGLSKKINLKNIKKNLKTLKGFFEAKKIIKQFDPDVVIGTGGYICGPVIFAAKKLNKKTLLHESNAFPGKAVKMLTKYTDTLLVSFDDVKKYVKHNRIVNVGTPIKLEKKNHTKQEKEEIFKKYNLDENKKTLLIFGGSQGAKKINDTVCQMLKNHDVSTYNIIWAPGAKNYEEVKENLKDIKMQNIYLTPYIYDMEEVMSISNLALSRSGAMTISELEYMGLPSFLVPLPNVSNNHQYYNAKVLADKGGAQILDNDTLNGDILFSKLKEVLDDDKIENKMRQVLDGSKKVDSQQLIYEEIKKVLE